MPTGVFSWQSYAVLPRQLFHDGHNLGVTAEREFSGPFASAVLCNFPFKPP